MRTLAVAGFCVLAVGGAVIAIVYVGFGGSTGGGARLQTTGGYAPLTVPKAHLVRQGGLILNEPDAPAQTWVSAVLSSLSGNHRYSLTVTNASNMGYINSFEWYAPTGVRILRVIGSSSGHCAPSGLTGFGGNQFKTVVLYPNILCENVDLKPPSCTCTGDGGSMTISFLLDTATNYSGTARVLTATPVLKVIPSYLK
jgi:hypothetical protein